MPGELIDPTSKIIIPQPITSLPNDIRGQILNNLNSITHEQIEALWEEIIRIIQEKSQKNASDELKLWEISQELHNYREWWKENISNLSEEIKQKIIEAAEKIPLRETVDNDGSRLIEFKLWNMIYKILNSKLENHTDDEYKSFGFYNDVNKRRVEIKLWWMNLGDIDNWGNIKLREYVKEKGEKWLHIPSIKEIHILLSELWKYVGLSKESDQIAMLMYITWIEWEYWSTMKFEDSRFTLYFSNNNRFFWGCTNKDISHAGLCLIDYKSQSIENILKKMEASNMRNMMKNLSKHEWLELLRILWIKLNY